MAVKEPRRTAFSHIVELLFEDVSVDCKNNYTLQINVDKRPYSITNETEQIVTYGALQIKPNKTLILDCENYGKPKGKVAWLKNNKTVNLDHEKFNLNAGKLEIFRTHPGDSSTYAFHVTKRYFGNVCLDVDEAIAPEQSQNKESDLSKTEIIKKHLSIRRNNESNFSVPSDPEVAKPLIDDSKFPKNSSKVAVKFVKQ
ncbi:hypothetical protein BpHYR1_045725 [Brachionus plicatilis]|uniref:Ig-like domain-containing protein n=1 Tax=Brachionus plicatilis TaxID=10195 RepID=A0A3M7PXL0_BRAPC|nr:hypothetical protein BpHYR1_045725 [Brachionus plicatilis]